MSCLEWIFQNPHTKLFFRTHRGCQIHHWDITCLSCRLIVDSEGVLTHNCNKPRVREITHNEPATSSNLREHSPAIFPNPSPARTDGESADPSNILFSPNTAGGGFDLFGIYPSQPSPNPQDGSTGRTQGGETLPETPSCANLYHSLAGEYDPASEEPY